MVGLALGGGIKGVKKKMSLAQNLKSLFLKNRKS